MTGYSVVIPAWNAAATLAETIGSVLAQGWAPAEVIVVDDGSTDATAEVAAGFGAAVRLIRQDNRGVGVATNTGLAACGQPLVALVDSDDLWLPDKAARQRDHLARLPDLAISCTALRLFRADAAGGRELGPIRPGLLRSSMMFPLAVFARVGPLFDPPGGRGDMVDWLARAREQGVAIEELPEPLTLRRVRPGSLSSGRDPALDRGYLLAARRAMLRARQGGGTA